LRCRWLLACAGALALLGAGAPGPLELRTLEGNEIRVLRGPDGPDWVLHFWATWCPECVEELPAVARAAQTCDPARVRVVAVNVAESPEQVQRYAAEHAIALEILLDPRGKVWRGAGFWGLPANLWWTRDGVRVREGAAPEDSWSRELRELGCTKAAP